MDALKCKKIKVQFDTLKKELFETLRHGHDESKSHSGLATIHDLLILTEIIMTALETLTDAVNQAATAQTELTTAVNAAIVHINTPGATDAQLLTVATAIQANTDSDKSLTLALNEALNPTPPPPAA